MNPVYDNKTPTSFIKLKYLSIYEIKKSRI